MLGKTCVKCVNILGIAKSPNHYAITACEEKGSETGSGGWRGERGEPGEPSLSGRNEMIVKLAMHGMGGKMKKNCCASLNCIGKSKNKGKK
jgi:hypothetical protein